MAVEKVFFRQNTNNVHPDSSIAQRLGLIPVHADADLFNYSQDPSTPTEDSTLVFQLSKSCSDSESSRFRTVSSDLMEWIPFGNQSEWIGPRPRMTPGIPITENNHGDDLDFHVYCVKGIGLSHSKFSPVAGCYYKLKPKIELTRPFIGKNAEVLQSQLPRGLVKISRKDRKAIICEEKVDFGCLNACVNEESTGVRIRRLDSHLLFCVESVGAMDSEEIVRRALRVLVDKCDVLLDVFDVFDFF